MYGRRRSARSMRWRGRSFIDPIFPQVTAASIVVKVSNRSPSELPRESWLTISGLQLDPLLPRLRSARFNGEYLRPLVGGWDVDVEVEHVVGVVLGFEVLESVVLRAVCASHSGFLMFGHEVHVTADPDGMLDQG